MTNCIPCLPGHYCPTTGIVMPYLKCTAGYWCKGGSLEPYGVSCPNGSFCPKGTPSPVSCPPGTYQPYTGKTSFSDCMACDPGMYCGISGLDAVTGPCMKGFFCIGNASSSNPTDGNSGDICPIGHYCTEKTSVPVRCPNATFMNHTGQFTLFTLLQYDYCPLSNPLNSTKNSII